MIIRHNRFLYVIMTCLFLSLGITASPGNEMFNRVFSKCTRMAIMPILVSEALFRDNKKFQLQNATLVSIEPLDL